MLAREQKRLFLSFFIVLISLDFIAGRPASGQDPTEPGEQYQLALAYQRGDGVAQNEETACDYFLKAANQGNREAQYKAGVCYDSGQGFAADMAQAVSWYSRAAEQGQPEAMFILGICYYNGEGVEASRDRARYWLDLAASQGHQQAGHMLDTLF